MRVKLFSVHLAVVLNIMCKAELDTVNIFDFECSTSNAIETIKLAKFKYKYFLILPLSGDNVYLLSLLSGRMVL
jgi:hypothetical protein